MIVAKLALLALLLIAIAVLAVVVVTLAVRGARELRRLRASPAERMLMDVEVDFDRELRQRPTVRVRGKR